MAYTETEMAQAAAAQRYRFSSILHQIAAPMINRGANDQQIADALCQRMGWCFIKSEEWAMIASLRHYLTL
jgi:hypothetical protein